MKKLRIAFLTSEFVSENKNGGGLANYLYRIALALKAQGHHPEIFVTSSARPSVLQIDSIRVNRVKVHNIFTKLTSLSIAKLLDAPFDGPVHYLCSAFALARSLERRHAQNTFDFVQSTNCSASGLFVRSLPDRPHLVRLSSKRDLWCDTDGYSSIGAKLVTFLEQKSIQKADIAYAPSQCIASECQKGWRNDVAVLRPPVLIETQPSEFIPSDVPPRYLIHFGQISSRKGSDIVARALVEVWKKSPDFKMVWAGRVNNNREFQQYLQLWGEKAKNIICLGAIPKEQLYSILKKSVASVLPSRVDNLPNTVIESLMFGIPVIGSRGASIDELVIDGINGKLIEIGNVSSLARAMLDFWHQGSSQSERIACTKQILEEFKPEFAVNKLIELAGY